MTAKKHATHDTYLASNPRCILHADLAAFFASVEQLDNPELEGKPVIVGGSVEDRGVVASASYEARAFGIRSAMPMSSALQRCPEVVRIPPRFTRYQEFSTKVMDLFHGFTDLVEPMSLDEAYLDVTDFVATNKPPESIAQDLKDRIRSELGLTISVGVATSKSVSKIASDLGKPDGSVVVSPGDERKFLASLGVRKLWGIGPKAAETLINEGIQTIGDLAAMSPEWFSAHFGKSGASLRALSHGIDERELDLTSERKSFSAETTLAEDTADSEVMHELVTTLSQRVSDHLINNGIRGRTVRIKLRLSNLATYTRQTTLEHPENSAEVITIAATILLRKELQPGRMFRLVGVGVAGIDAPIGSEQAPSQQGRILGF